MNLDKDLQNECSVSPNILTLAKTSSKTYKNMLLLFMNIYIIIT